MNRRTLTGLSLLVLGLVVLVFVDQPRPRPTSFEKDKILVELSRGAVVSALSIQGGPSLVTRDGKLVLEDGSPTDEGAVRDLASALTYLEARRTVPRKNARGLDAPRLVLTVTFAGTPVTLRVGATEEALGRTWVARDDRNEAYLVDEFAARAIARTEDDLRRRQLVERADSVAIGAIRIDKGCVALAGGCARVDADKLQGLSDALAALVATRFLPSGGGSLAFTVGAARYQLGDPCPNAADEIAISDGKIAACVPKKAADAIAAIAAEKPEDWVDRALLATPIAEIARVTIQPAGLALERNEGGTWRAGERRLDGDAVTGWLESLAGWRALALVPVPPGPPKATLSVGTEVIELLDATDGTIVRRAGEPIALRFHPSLAAVFATRAEVFSDRQLLSFDGFPLRAIETPDERAERGATVDAWDVVRPAKVPADAAVIEKIRELAAELHAAAYVGESDPGPWRTIRFEIDETPGAPAQAQSLELGRRVDDGCLAKKPQGPVFRLAAPTCDALEAHLASRQVFTAEPDDVTALVVDGKRWERHGAWFGPDGARLAAKASAELDATVRGLATAQRVAGYREVTAGRKLTIETRGETIELLVDGKTYGRAGRPVEYELGATLSL